MAADGREDLNDWAAQAMRYELDAMEQELEVLHHITIPIRINLLPQGVPHIKGMIRDRARGISSSSDPTKLAKSYFTDAVLDSVREYEDYLGRYHRSQNKVPSSIPIQLSRIEKDAITSYLAWALFRSLDRYRTGHRCEELEKVGEATT